MLFVEQHQHLSYGVMFADFISIGYRKDINAGSLGTMLMWKNFTAFYQEATENNLNLYYS
ncbi:hypothetical protein CWS51_15655 [Klebsiella michiganensis]|nr:hypothetical protein [Klebsiella michiganensis]